MARPSSAFSRPEGPELPAVDERIVAPESRYEIIDGELTYVSPAHEPHATRCSKLSALLEAHVADDYDVAADMLTRTSETSDIAPDASIFPRARDPRTGGRQLEELAFEVVATQALSNAAAKAAKLSARGVRRVFAIDTDRKRALVWSPATASWEILPQDAVLEDVVLAAPLPMKTLVHAVKTDDAVAEALLVRKNRVVVQAVSEGEARGRAEGEARGRAEGEARGRAEGEARGKVEALLAIFAAQGRTVPAEMEARLRAARDGQTLDAWIRRAATGATVEELLANAK